MVTITNLVFRVFTATLIGIYTIVEVPLSFLVSFGILNLSVKNEAKNIGVVEVAYRVVAELVALGGR